MVSLFRCVPSLCCVCLLRLHYLMSDRSGQWNFGRQQRCMKAAAMRLKSWQHKMMVQQ